MSRFQFEPVKAPAAPIVSDGLTVPAGYQPVDLPASPPNGARKAWRNPAGRIVVTGEPGIGDENDPEYRQWETAMGSTKKKKKGFEYWWWEKHAKKFPQLALVARMYLVIMASSAPTESLS